MHSNGTLGVIGVEHWDETGSKLILSELERNRDRYPYIEPWHGSQAVLDSVRYLPNAERLRSILNIALQYDEAAQIIEEGRVDDYLNGNSGAPHKAQAIRNLLWVRDPRIHAVFNMHTMPDSIVTRNHGLLVPFMMMNPDPLGAICGAVRAFLYYAPEPKPTKIILNGNPLTLYGQARKVAACEMLPYAQRDRNYFKLYAFALARTALTLLESTHPPEVPEIPDVQFFREVTYVTSKDARRANAPEAGTVPDFTPVDPRIGQRLLELSGVVADPNTLAYLEWGTGTAVRGALMTETEPPKAWARHAA